MVGGITDTLQSSVHPSLCSTRLHPVRIAPEQGLRAEKANRGAPLEMPCLLQPEATRVSRDVRSVGEG